MILTLPLCTVELTTTLVKQAMETVQGIDVEQWLQEKLEQSALSMRKRMFQTPGKDTEVA